MRFLHKLLQFDVSLFNGVFYHGQRASLRSIAKAVSQSADGYLFLLVPGTLWLLNSASLLLFLQLLLTGLLAERICYWCLKNTLRRRRPQDYLADVRSLVDPPDRFSFPSGHTSSAFLMATCMTLVYQENAASLYLWSSLVALSRVILGVHYPGDTVAGAAIGSGIALVAGTAIGM